MLSHGPGGAPGQVIAIVQLLLPWQLWHDVGFCMAKLGWGVGICFLPQSSLVPLLGATK